MADKETREYKLHLSFKNTPKKATIRTALLDKFKEWFKQETFSLPLEVSRSNKTTMAISSHEKKILIFLSFSKPIKIFLLTVCSEERIRELNTIFNKMVGYLNALLGDIASEISVYSDTSVIISKEKTKAWMANRIDNDSLIRIKEQAGVNLKTVALGTQFNFENHQITWLSMFFETAATQIRIDSQLKANIPLDLVQNEMNQINKVEKMINQIINMRT